jgi:nucleotide-binding universal stress UspA family protein
VVEVGLTAVRSVDERSLWGAVVLNRVSGGVMENGIRTCLLATGFSEDSRHYIRHSTAVARQMNAGMIVLHVVDHLQESCAGTAVALLGEERWRGLLYALNGSNNRSTADDADEHRLIEAALHALCREVDDEQAGDHPPIERLIVIEEGDVAVQVLRYAGERDCDLIILGSGRRVAAGTVVSPVIKAVLHRAERPVLVLPPPQD